MPEGDTIFRTAERLRAALQGKRVVSARPDQFKRLAGTTVSDVQPVGKHLMIRFDNGLALHTHMRMRGSWQVYPRGQKAAGPAWQLKAILETDDMVAACFAAPVVELIRDESSHIGHLGPDILGAEWDVQLVVRRARSLGEAAIGEVVLDQRVTAGIGNVYRCESLWQRKLNPWKPVDQLTDDELASLFEVARQAMLANLGGGPRRRFPGYGKGAVHGRGGLPCPRCGTRIKVRALGEHARLVYWCPECQS
ncbi:MAG TPA: DNA-formamidopyrimidine glycosylase family protein [Candidatus Dormibacteraeota bacterium]|nr:DNA-formamidopyrimidine glycosylase family protein [Candidatus Dormibacteraeota bacterium]